MHAVPIDAQPVRQHAVFASESPRESQRGLAGELVEHRLRWGSGAVQTRFARVRLEHLSMAVLHYGAEVEVEPEPFDDFLLVQMPLRGRAEMQVGQQRASVGPRMAAVVSPRRALRFHWEAGCEQLLIKVPLAALFDVARRRLSVADAALQTERIDFQAALPLDTPAGAAWSLQVQQLLASVPQPGSAGLHPVWRRQVEESAMLFLLTEQPNSIGVAGPSPLDAMQAYLQRRLCAPIALHDLARAAGVSERALHTLCRERYGLPPMSVLRNARLDAVRRCLQRGDAAVLQAAVAHGFGHPGRFSANYRQRFGELPSDTARSAAAAR